MASNETLASAHDREYRDVEVQIENSKSVDCLACRLTSGSGVFAAGLYVGYHARKQPLVGKIITSSVSVALCCLGTCRLLNLPPFRHPTSPSQQLLKRSHDHDNKL